MLLVYLQPTVRAPSRALIQETHVTPILDTGRCHGREGTVVVAETYYVSIWRKKYTYISSNFSQKVLLSLTIYFTIPLPGRWTSTLIYVYFSKGVYSLRHSVLTFLDQLGCDCFFVVLLQSWDKLCYVSQSNLKFLDSNPPAWAAEAIHLYHHAWSTS